MTSGSPFRTVSILGVGLMGASLAGALKQLPFPPVIRGSTPDHHEGEKALARGLVDFYSPDNPTVVKGADLVVLAAPPSEIPRIWDEIAEGFPSDALLTDLASVKTPLFDRFIHSHQTSFPLYISSHPMAGRELNGVDAARPDLFKGRLTFLIPFSGNQTESDMLLFRQFWRQTGSPTQIIISPEEHDRILARISHLPHVIAYALLGMLTQSPKRTDIPNWDWPIQKGGALSDILRIAWSSPDLWSDILIQNQPEVLMALDDFEKDMETLKKILQKKDQASLIALLGRWQENGKGDMRHGREE
ncbi:MAG: prephenate dehydrogenase [Leptospirales bacterium]